jgi:hypothetical protein
VDALGQAKHVDFTWAYGDHPFDPFGVEAVPSELYKFVAWRTVLAGKIVQACRMIKSIADTVQVLFDVELCLVDCNLTDTIIKNTTCSCRT